ncbi:MAG: tRNA lysidine(34) synthetase TilS [Lentimicrobiaceae bacterium]|jgi:tRNA(Ile)-lysidine synthase|nr:tRNA lysidine(34) synthetase TilS [Lentimicrobiaceae bacterium]
MKEQLRYFIEKNKLVEPNDKVLVAVSGGIDSVVLLHLLKELNYDIALVHCNFSLRGAESDSDELFVKNLAKKLKIKAFVKKFNTNVYAKNNKISTQMAARDLRYRWFSELAQKENFSKIALAHHADDQVETFFINLFRRSGITGLKGMLPRNGQIIRPLLFANRTMIATYATENAISWHEDRTNQETKYLRNKIRHQLLPVLEEIQLGAITAIENSLIFLANENACYKQLLTEKLKAIIRQKDTYLAVEKSHFPNNRYGKQLLFEWIKIYGFNKTQLDLIFEALRNEAIGTIFRSATHCLTIDRTEIQILENKPDDIPITYKIETTTTSIDTPIKLRFAIQEMNTPFAFDKNENIAQFDFETLSFPLEIRKWKQGDRFKPLGMKGSKLVSDYFVDHQFSVFQKQQTYLLVDRNNAIVWIIGHRIADNNKITQKTSKIVTVTFLK